MDSKYLDRNFIKEAEKFRTYLEGIKNFCDNFDKANPSIENRISQLERIKDEFFRKANAHFDKIWEIAGNFPEVEYKLHQQYYFTILSPLLGFPEINKYIYEKPLGYPGDYVMMNYIYEYHNKYLGKSSYEMLINNYTCNIPISKSNINRKEYLKHKIY